MGNRALYYIIIILAVWNALVEGVVIEVTWNVWQILYFFHFSISRINSLNLVSLPLLFLLSKIPLIRWIRFHLCPSMPRIDMRTSGEGPKVSICRTSANGRVLQFHFRSLYYKFFYSECNKTFWRGWIIYLISKDKSFLLQNS